LLDQVVACAFSPSDPNRASANTCLMRLQECPDLWTRCDAILEGSSRPDAKFFGLQILDSAIRTRWKILPVEQREGIKNYIVTKVISMSSDEANLADPGTKMFIGKLNLVLVQVLKQEWPHNWPTFISDLVGASKTSEVLCENNMQILKLLSEEVFDYGREVMTSEKIMSMKESLNGEFSSIYQLCELILKNSKRASLLKVTLQTLQRFLTWIPLGFIFQTDLIHMLLDSFFAQPQFRNDALECLAEIGTLADLEPQYDTLFQSLYLKFMARLNEIFTPDTDLATAYDNGSDDDCIFIKRLALFFCGFFRAHIKVLETPVHSNTLLQGLFYLCRISEVPDNEVFKICLEYWHLLTADLYESEVKLQMSGRTLELNRTFEKKHQYSVIMSGVRQVMISRMAKPEEVLVVEDENGDVVRETTKDTEQLAQYKTMKECLVYLTHLNYDDTENIMLQKLAMEVKLALSLDSTQPWPWGNLNTLCWGIGSISGAMNEDEEKRFLVTVIKDLLGLCEEKRGKDNKAIVASNIMYVVGQYPRFLKQHWKFLKTVVNKLFEFMHESHPGVQDMACDTFLKIAQKCKRKFVTLQAEERQPFIVELVDTLPTIISDLEPHQVQSFYESVGTLLSDKGQQVTIDRVLLLTRLMELPNRSWKMIIDSANTNVESLMHPDTIKEVIKILKSNAKVCNTVGPLYRHQLQFIFLDMLTCYKTYSTRISETVAAQGAIATRMDVIRKMRTVKKEILKLLSVFIEKSGGEECPPQQIASGFLPPVLDPILNDYKSNVPQARDSEVLMLFTVVVEKLRMDVVNDVPRIMESLFEVTVQMITTNFEDYPEHRVNFFGFLRVVNLHCFPALFKLPPDHQRLVVDSVVWAMKHTGRDISETGLDILNELLTNVGVTPSLAQGFYQQFLIALISDVLAALTDRLHKSGFKMHATLLQLMFHLVAKNSVTVLLFDASTQPPGQTNMGFLSEHISTLLITSFPNLTRAQVSKFVTGLFDLTLPLEVFKTHLRNFLIELQEFSSEDNNGLFDEETSNQRNQMQQAEAARRAAVPGILKPSEIGMGEDDDDL
jgi:exportin-1